MLLHSSNILSPSLLNAKSGILLVTIFINIDSHLSYQKFLDPITCIIPPTYQLLHSRSKDFRPWMNIKLKFHLYIPIWNIPVRLKARPSNTVSISSKIAIIVSTNFSVTFIANETDIGINKKK